MMIYKKSKLWKSLPPKKRKSLEKRYHSNQLQAAVEIANSGVSHILLSALMQSGKTGVALAVAEIKTLLKPLSRVLYLVPPDKALQNQTKERIKNETEGLLPYLLGGKPWNASEIYKKGKAYDELYELCTQSLAIPDMDILVIYDECHLAIGGRTTTKDIQQIPAFFRDVLGTLPGLSTNSQIQWIGISATGFAYNGFLAKHPNTQIFEEILLQPGTGYLGMADFFEMGRFRPHFTVLPYKKRPAQHADLSAAAWQALQLENFTADMTAKLKEFKKRYANSPRYFVGRFTTRQYRAAFKEAAAAAGFGLGEYREYTSSAKNVKEFAELLKSSPSSCMALCLIQTYKQGKTLDTSRVGAWYEGDTTGGRHDSSLVQSAGRCTGYTKGNETFPIYCDLRQVAKWVEYELHLRAGNLMSKRDLAMSDTHVKTKKSPTPERSLIIKSTWEEVEKEYIRRYPGRKVKYSRQSAQDNHSFDAIGDFINKVQRQDRGAGTLTMVDMNGPSSYPSAQSTWDGNPQLHNMFGIIVDTGKYVLEETISSNNTYLNKN